MIRGQTSGRIASKIASYEKSLTAFARFIKENHRGDLKTATRGLAQEFLAGCKPTKVDAEALEMYFSARDRSVSQKEAIAAMKLMTKKAEGHRPLVQSVRTNGAYRDCLTAFASYLKSEKKRLSLCSREEGTAYLRCLAERGLSQKAIDQSRQALQAYFSARDMAGGKVRLEIVRAKVEQKLTHRAYTHEQIAIIAKHQDERNALATRIAYAAGLRAHELLTLKRREERSPDVRTYEDGTEKNLETKWQGREKGVSYTVQGKGGLVREVRIPKDLAARLEERRLVTPMRVVDREVNYETFYDIAGGNTWSSSFSTASKRALGWSTGAHGLRHAYAQERLCELQRSCTYERALETVSQEMGHYRPSITLTYLR